MKNLSLAKGAYTVFALFIALMLILSLITSTADADGNTTRVPSPLYVLKADRDQIGVYGTNTNEVLYYLDTPLSSLPDYDQDLLYDGIPIYSEQELDERLQDFDG